MTAREPILRLDRVEAVYDGSIQVLRGISLEVPEGGIVALLGGNGVGKSTTLKAVSGMLRVEHGAVTSGQVFFMGEKIANRGADELVAMGLIQVIEGRRVFSNLTVEENLRAGAYRRRDGAGVRNDLDRVYGYFPALTGRRRGKAGYLSGGEQQMLAIGRAFMARPKLMLLDEPSMGLAPILVRQIFAIIQEMKTREGLSVLIAEQNARLALGLVDHGYVLEGGRVVLQGTAASLRTDPDVSRFYLGFRADGAQTIYSHAVEAWRARRQGRKQRAIDQHERSVDEKGTCHAERNIPKNEPA